MHTNNEESTKNTAKAVKELLSREDLTDYFTELSLMHGAFIRSDFADCQRTRTAVTGTFENLRDFILDLQSIQISKEAQS